MQNKKIILIVEDEEPLFKILVEKFKLDGFEVFLAKNGLEGLDIVRNNKIDLILLDIVMPKMDGLTMLRALRSEQLPKQPEVIILTNLSGEENIAEAMANGSYDYLIKSDWGIEDLMARVKEKLK